MYGMRTEMKFGDFLSSLPSLHVEYATRTKTETEKGMSRML